MIEWIVMERFTALTRRSQFFIFVIGILFGFGIWFLEMNTGRQISYAIFYLIPVSFVSWYTNKWYGFAVSLACAGMWLFFDLTMFPEHPVGITYWNAAMRLGFYAIVSYLLAALEDAHRRERSLARIDRTTAAPNSRHFYEVAETEVNRSKRYGHPISAIYLDLDNFKAVNDRFGHNTGDELLCRVVETMKEQIRDSDTVARLGGDEFAILLPETGKESAEAVIKKVHENLLAAMNKNNWPVTFSIGAVTFLHAPVSANEIIQKADELMYSVKHSGKNRVRHVTLSEPVFSDNELKEKKEIGAQNH
jgi:diguanylate cyclase (GGDEF)-like protein